MTSENKTVLSQKEYLKKYLSKGDKDDKKKKRKRKSVSCSTVLKRSQIIDDDIDFSNMRALDNDEVELYQLDEDAPQIAGIIDDRPVEVQAMEYYNNPKRWKVFGAENGDGEVVVQDKYEDDKSVKSSELIVPSGVIHNKDSVKGLSPPRGERRKHSSDSDLSPPRHSRKSRQGSDSDLSPPRRPDNDSKRIRDIDRSKKSSRFEKRTKSSDSDLSPPRRSKKFHDYSNAYDRRGSDFKSKRRKGDSDDEDNRGRKEFRSKHENLKRSHERDSYNLASTSKSKDGNQKMVKTLDGKRAGLQDAKQLKKELADFKEKEDKMFSKMSSEMSGQGAQTVMRERTTGQKRDFEKERKQEVEKAEKRAKENEKYEKWGRGLKQIEDETKKLATAVHEMSKPLARFADDEELDKYLKAQEREGDPMLDYIRKKQKESISLTEKKPEYQGSFLPNRFGIRPGYRWDGVDRSSGYEKQWFTTQNNRKARDEDAYKWSVADM